MSRIGKQPIVIPEGTDVSMADGYITVKGKGGELRKKLHEDVIVTIEDGSVIVTPANDSPLAKALWGTFSSLIQSMVSGINTPFEKKLSVEGIGYKVNLKDSVLVLDVGFSHQVEVPVLEGLEVVVEKNEVTVRGADKERVGQFAADVRAVKKPEPYKGKGIRYVGEVVRRKEGKRAAA